MSKEGVRHRRVICSHNGLILHDDYCDQQLKPIEQESCTTNITCFGWFIGEWSSVKKHLSNNNECLNYNYILF